MRRGSKWDLIGREELKEELDRDDNLKLAMVLGGWGYRAKHMPGSLNIPATELAADVRDPEYEIVVYCSGDPCLAGECAYYRLTQRGYKHVRRYAGAIADWEEAGYPIEGD